MKSKELLQGYSKGIFPMADSIDGKIQWYTADPRGIIDLTDYYVSKRLLRYIKKTKYEVKINSEFEKVMRACAARPSPEGTWISEDMVKSYVNLHKLGHAHCVEIWMKNILVGGLYGVTLKGAFFGESMFKTVSNASKYALYHLIKRLNEKRFKLLDVQMLTPTTEQFGAKAISREEYLLILQEAMQYDCQFY